MNRYTVTRMYIYETSVAAEFWANLAYECWLGIGQSLKYNIVIEINRELEAEEVK